MSKKKIELYIEQDEIHEIIKKHFNLDKDTIMESDTNAGITTFTYETKEQFALHELNAEDKN